MAININSEAYCRKAYLNYHCYGNTMGLTSEDMGKITQAWEGKIQSWQATVSSDENEYEFDDSDYSNYKSEGKQAAKEATGHDGKSDWKKVTTDGLASGFGATVSAFGTKFLGKAANEALTTFGSTMMTKLGANVGKKVTEKLAGKTVEKAVEEGAVQVVGGVVVKENAKESGKKALENSGSWSIAAPLALATWVAYMADKANKEEKEACDALQTEMSGAQATLGEAQTEMEAMSEEIMSLSDEANTINEDANSEIEKEKTEFDLYMQTFLAIQEKIQNGEELSDSEKALYKEVMGYMEEINASINKISETTTTDVTKLYDEIGTYQEGYDVTAETMGEIEGLTDFAEGFDEATRTMCYVEAAAQTLNAYSGTKASIKAFAAAAASLGFNAWAWACGAMGATAAVGSGIAATEQFQWAGEVGTEIDMRKATQSMNTETMEFYDEEIDAFDGFMQGIEDLELEIPDDLALPEDVSFTGDETESTGDNVIPDTLKLKKEEEQQQ